MKRAALEFDPKAQLLRILEDYPGGQLVSEAVQNAEDGGASQFTLLLDLRHHAIEHQAIAGPAFVLIDNGRGFSEREWTSLRAVNKSEKRSSPSEIGAFGMGSRSYFHYSDVTLVASRGQYGGIDPLKVLPGRHGGWHVSLSEGEIRAEADVLFSPTVAGLCEGFDRMQRGALIRLPLRREQDVLREQEQSDDGQPLAPEITVARAEELFAQWAESAPRLLLFLTSMRRVSFYRWRSGAAQPELVADTNKKYLRGGPRPRLPPSLPDNVTRTYATLREHIVDLSASARAALSATQEAVVRVELSQPAPQGASSSVSAIDWFVCERLDFITPSVLDAMRKGCCSHATPVIPVVGIAMPLTADGVPFVGVPYCFLPIGQMRTGLPVQVNGSFRPTPNRRELWLPGEELDGNHEKFALWNEVLMNDAVPALWLEALRNLASAGIATTAGGIATTAGRQFDILSVLPDLAAVDNVWRPCAEKLYTLISGEPLLPHSGSRQWVMPREALGVVAPAALASQVKGVMRLYERCPDPALREQVALVSASAAPSAQAASTSRANCVVTLPKHVLDGCERFSALRRVRIDHVLRCVLRADRSAFEGPTAVDQLRPILLALMSYAGQAPFSSAEHGEWRGELADVPWVETSGGATVKLSAAFAPSDALAKWQLGVVGSNTAQLGASDAATTLAGIAWGLKPGLSWADCVAEAQMIEKDRDRPLAERVAWAERLIKYLEHSFGTVGLFGPCEDEEATKCRALLSAIAFCPAVEPSGRFDSAASLCLRSPLSMQSSSNAPFVWAVEPRAKVSATLLRFAKLSVEVVVRQIIALSAMPAPCAEASVLSQHLLSAARRLSQFPPAELSPLSDSELGARLREAAWVPGMGGGKMGGGDQLRFFPPGRVAHQLHGDLWPRFGRLPDDWRAGLSTFLQTLGVKQTLSAAVLAAELRDVAGEGQHSKRFALSIRMAAELAAALEAGAVAPDEVFVPTTDGRLLPAAHVFINDAPWHSRAAGAATLLHEAVSPADGKRLGCSSVREELARLCEEEGEVEGEVFGQSERLSTRIENLLLKYNDEKDLFVEQCVTPPPTPTPPFVVALWTTRSDAASAPPCAACRTATTPALPRFSSCSTTAPTTRCRSSRLGTRLCRALHLSWRARAPSMTTTSCGSGSSAARRSASSLRRPVALGSGSTPCTT